MEYSGVFEIKIDKKSTLIVQGGADEFKFNLEFRLPHAKKSIKAEWAREDIVKFGTRELTDGLPIKLTIDKRQTKKVYYREKRLYEAGQSKPWTQSDLKPWWEVFSRMGRGAAVLPDLDLDTFIVETKDLQDWAGCVASFAGAGAGIGGAIGLVVASVPGAATGAAVGGSIGASIGLGYCTSKELDSSEEKKGAS